MFRVLSVPVIRNTITAVGWQPLVQHVTLDSERCGERSNSTTVMWPTARLWTLFKRTLPQRSRSSATYVVPVVVNYSYCTADDGYGKYPKRVFCMCIYIYIYMCVCVCVCVCAYTVEPLFTNLIRSWRPFVIRNVRKPKLCVLSQSYTATDALPPILPACRQPLSPACVFVTRDTVRHPRRFFFPDNLFVNRFVRDERRSWTEVPL
jgi:hypothetical protein